MAEIARAVAHVLEAEVGKPGTNWKQVTPENRRKVNPLVRHYMGKAHPFTSCVRDNTKRFGPERAKKVCAVVKDMGEGRTTWRKGGRKAQEAAIDGWTDRLLEAAEGVPVSVLQEALIEQCEAEGMERAVLEALVTRGEVLEAARGGMVKCPECETLNGKSSAKCKNCGHDLGKVAAKAKRDGRTDVQEAEVSPMTAAIREAIQA